MDFAFLNRVPSHANDDSHQPEKNKNTGDTRFCQNLVDNVVGFVDAEHAVGFVDAVEGGGEGFEPNAEAIAVEKHFEGGEAKNDAHAGGFFAAAGKDVEEADENAGEGDAEAGAEDEKQCDGGDAEGGEFEVAVVEYDDDTAKDDGDPGAAGIGGDEAGEENDQEDDGSGADLKGEFFGMSGGGREHDGKEECGGEEVGIGVADGGTASEALTGEEEVHGGDLRVKDGGDGGGSCKDGGNNNGDSEQDGEFVTGLQRIDEVDNQGAEDEEPDDVEQAFQLIIAVDEGEEEDGQEGGNPFFDAGEFDNRVSSEEFVQKKEGEGGDVDELEGGEGDGAVFCGVEDASEVGGSDHGRGGPAGVSDRFESDPGECGKGHHGKEHPFRSEHAEGG